MIRFELDRADPLAVRIAVAACRSPLRVERRGMEIAIVAARADAERARRLWLRAGLDPNPALPWPEPRVLAHGVLEIGHEPRCIASVSVDQPPREGELYLAVAPVSPADALCAISLALDVRLPRPFGRRPRRLAKIAAAILRGDDGVVAAKAFAVEPASSHPFRGLRGVRLRMGAAAAWRDIGAPHGGVWRPLRALQPWWETAR
ncbi:MAG TPA: hypothetical protein VJQ09_08945 [Candidatus Limnocylindria bacterium]|nr:hypothetical protein [Candidatus Limnocylindria bacterium]